MIVPIWFPPWELFVDLNGPIAVKATESSTLILLNFHFTEEGSHALISQSLSWWFWLVPLSSIPEGTRETQLLCLSHCTCAFYCGALRSSRSSSGCSFPEGSQTESWSVHTSKEAKGAPGKQSNFSSVAKPVSHSLVTQSKFYRLSTIESCLMRKLTPTALQELAQFSTVRPKNLKNCD